MFIIILKEKAIFGENGTTFQVLNHTPLDKSQFKNLRNFSQKQIINRKRYLSEIEAMASDFAQDIFKSSDIVIVTNLRNVHNIVKKEKYLKRFEKKNYYFDIPDSELTNKIDTF